MNRAGQISLEFLIVAGFAVTLLVAMLAIALVQINSTVTDSTLASLADVAGTVQQELLTARSVGDGYERTFHLPGNIQRRSYTIALGADGNASVVTVTTAGRALSIRTPRCDGTLGPGSNTITTENGSIWCTS